MAMRADYAGEVDVDPLDALLYTVRRGARLASHWQQAAANAETDEAFQLAAANEAKALGELNRWAKNAVDGGVAERQVQLAERLGDALTAVAEEALEALEKALGVSLSVEARTAYATTYGAGIGRLEAGAIEVAAEDM